MPTVPPKRRGRPPGSKNQPKLPEAPDYGYQVVRGAKRSETTGPKIVPFGGSAPFDQAGYVEGVEVFGPDPIRVLLVTKRAFSTPADEREVEWPPEWRLPQAGESIRLNKDYAGFVEYIDWDLERKIVVAKLR